MRARKFWGWGYEDELLTLEEENNIDKRIAKTFELDSVERIEIPKIENVNLPESSLKSPNSLKAIVSNDKLERLNHTMENLSRTQQDQF